ncbi:glycosyltransferase [Staphylothermus hellenicus]|uniref:Glycosyl transferase group 1 n=1 Tax=Staphylothermus hellenicus (strain DSM 12710 / JCM 10830 / BK20S6-10-b1 / P8) TaxID=591019 RepID=D7D8B0_STAHD|nr:glycosyltransferase [Staphylothermus hellenicus]ADI32006.1 glycosyl transferase group 1 [Staphylothermus hellenicus DSM 12710]
MSLRVLVIYSGRLGIGGANVFLQDLLEELSKITKAQFYLASIYLRNGILRLELGVAKNRIFYKYVTKAYSTLHVNGLNTALERVSKFMEVFVELLKPNLMLVNSVEPVVLAIIEKVMDKCHKSYIIVHDGGFFCPLKHMWDPIKGRPCNMPCLALEEPPKYCVAAEVLLKIGYIQPLFNPLRPKLLKPAKKISVSKDLQGVWEIARTVLKHSTVIVPSKFMASLIKRFANIDATIIRHGAPAELFALAREPRRAGRVRVGFIGDISLHKGVHVLLEAIDLIRRHRRDLARSVAFYIAGKVHNLSSVSVKIISKYKHLLRRHVHILGFVRSRTSIYRLLDAVVLPSICHENAPLTVIEGIASGRHIIASNVGGVPEYLGTYPRGLLVKPGDPYALAEALEHAVEKVVNVKNPSEALDTYRYVNTISDVAARYAHLLLGDR